MNNFLQTSRFRLDLNVPMIMGIVNVTPDSFSGQAEFMRGSTLHVGSVIEYAERCVKDGAQILDIGGESSRPGAQALDSETEWSRVGEVLKELTRWQVPISLDSYHLETQKRALDLGVDIINDIWALRKEGVQDLLRGYSCAVCLMHMQGEPSTMQRTPLEGGALQGFSVVKDFLEDRVSSLLMHGFAAERIIVDPGIGFGKTVQQNLYLLKNQASLLELGYPLLIGWSRKSTLGHVTGCEPKDRLGESLAALVMTLERGAKILRVHDVRESVKALKVWLAVQGVSA